MKHKTKLYFFVLFVLVYSALFITDHMVHEIVGVSFIGFLLLHLGINRAWFTNLWKGTYTTKRKLMLLSNGLFFLCMVGAIVTGLMYSRDLFPDLPIHMAGKSFKQIHKIFAYGTIAFLCAHTFLHIQVIKHYILTLLGKVKPVRQG